MIEEQRLKQRRRHFFKVRVVIRLGSEEHAFKEASVAYAMLSAKAIDQSFLDDEDFIEGKKLDGATRQVADRLSKQTGNALVRLSREVLQHLV
jgi:hypothetical protein